MKFTLRNIALLGWWIMMADVFLTLSMSFYFLYYPSPLKYICGILLLVIGLSGCSLFLYAITIQTIKQIKELLKRL